MSSNPGLRVAYVMSRFPKLTETFVLEEMRSVERAGVTVDLHPLLHERGAVVHPEAARWEQRAEYTPLLSPSILRSHAWFLVHRPRRYVSAAVGVLVGTWGSARYFLAAVGLFPKVVHLARVIEADGVDHVHCHFASHPALAGHVIHELTSTPYSFTAHGSDIHRDRHMLRQKVASAAFVVAISDDNGRVVQQECGPVTNVRVLRCGIDTSFFTPPAVRPPATPLQIVCVGTLHEVKGQAHLLEACGLLARSGIDLRCHLVGEGRDRPVLEARAAALGIGPFVTFHGSLVRADVRTLLRSSHLLVAPSVASRDGRREGIPVVLMEAMACGLPVVASRLSGIPELVHDEVDGILVTPRDVEGLATALKRLGEDAALRGKMGRAGRRWVERHHDVDTQAARLVEQIQAAVR